MGLKSRTTTVADQIHIVIYYMYEDDIYLDSIIFSHSLFAAAMTETKSLYLPGVFHLFNYFFFVSCSRSLHKHTEFEDNIYVHQIKGLSAIKRDTVLKSECLEVVYIDMSGL